MIDREKDGAPLKWTAPLFGIVRDKDGNIVELEGFGKFTEEQERNIIENTGYFRSISPDPED